MLFGCGPGGADRGLNRVPQHDIDIVDPERASGLVLVDFFVLDDRSDFQLRLALGRLFDPFDREAFYNLDFLVDVLDRAEFHDDLVCEGLAGAASSEVDRLCNRNSYLVGCQIRHDLLDVAGALKRAAQDAEGERYDAAMDRRLICRVPGIDPITGRPALRGLPEQLVEIGVETLILAYGLPKGAEHDHRVRARIHKLAGVVAWPLAPVAGGTDDLGCLEKGSA